MNKICTSIEQSKKLIELGVDVKTADMFYMYRHWGIDENTIGNQSDASVGFDSDFYYGADNGKTYHYIPAWSFTALFIVLPQETRLIKSATGKMYHCDCPKGNIDKWFDNPFDAAFEMICWLLENKKL